MSGRIRDSRRECKNVKSSHSLVNFFCFFFDLGLVSIFEILTGFPETQVLSCTRRIRWVQSETKEIPFINSSTEFVRFSTTPSQFRISLILTVTLKISRRLKEETASHCPLLSDKPAGASEFNQLQLVWEQPPHTSAPCSCTVCPVPLGGIARTGCTAAPLHGCIPGTAHGIYCKGTDSSWCPGSAEQHPAVCPRERETRDAPLNSFFRKSWKFCRPFGSRISSLKLKAHRSTRILVGISTLQRLNTNSTASFMHLNGRLIKTKMLECQET